MHLRVGDRFALKYDLLPLFHTYEVVSVITNGYLAYEVVPICVPGCGKSVHRFLVGDDEIVYDEFDLMVRHLQEDNDAARSGR